VRASTRKKMRPSPQLLSPEYTGEGLWSHAGFGVAMIPWASAGDGGVAGGGGVVWGGNSATSPTASSRAPRSPGSPGRS